MYLDRRKPGVDDGIVERIAVVRQGSRIDDDARGLRAFGLQPVDKRALVIGLERPDGKAESFRFVGNYSLDVLQGRGAVVRRITPAELVKVGAVDEQYRLHCKTVSRSSIFSQAVQLRICSGRVGGLRDGGADGGARWSRR